MNQSKLITFIGGFYIFGGIIVLLSLFFDGGQLNIVFNLPNVPDRIVKAIVGMTYIPLGYLYVKRVHFSFWIMLILSIILFCVSADLTTELSTQPSIGNMIYSFFVVIVTVARRKEFCNSIR